MNYKLVDEVMEILDGTGIDPRLKEKVRAAITEGIEKTERKHRDEIERILTIVSAQIFTFGGAGTGPDNH